MKKELQNRDSSSEQCKNGFSAETSGMGARWCQQDNEAKLCAQFGLTWGCDGHLQVAQPWVKIDCLLEVGANTSKHDKSMMLNTFKTHETTILGNCLQQRCETIEDYVARSTLHGRSFARNKALFCSGRPHYIEDKNALDEDTKTTEEVEKHLGDKEIENRNPLRGSTGEAKSHLGAEGIKNRNPPRRSTEGAKGRLGEEEIGRAHV